MVCAARCSYAFEAWQSGKLDPARRLCGHHLRDGGWWSLLVRELAGALAEIAQIIRFKIGLSDPSSLSTGAHPLVEGESRSTTFPEKTGQQRPNNL